MWEKLLGLFKDTYDDDPNYVTPSIAKRDARREQLASQSSLQSQQPEISEPGKGTLIGFDYLKGLKDDEDDMGNIKRFINLNKLLRGNYKD